MKIESGTNRQTGLPLLLLLFLEGITVDIPVPVSQFLAPKSHEIDLMSRCILRISANASSGIARIATMESFALKSLRPTSAAIPRTAADVLR